MFPEIIHQTWRTKELSGIPEFRACSESWRLYHPGYRYMLWDDQENEAFVKSNYAWYYDTWRSFDKNIKRLDSIRYMWMHTFGGVYADLDLECLQPLDQMMRRQCADEIMLFCDFDREGHCLSANPALIISKPGNRFWLDVLRYAAENRNRYVTECTGPFALGRLASRQDPGSRIALLDQNRLFIRKHRQPFYLDIPGNEGDADIYRHIYCTSPKPAKYFEDRKRKLVADWHGTPDEFRWHHEYSRFPRARAFVAGIAARLRYLVRGCTGLSRWP